MSKNAVTRRGHESKFYAYRNLVQVIPSGAWTQVQLDTKLFDLLGEFDEVTNYRFVPNKAGYYFVMGYARFAVLPVGTVSQLRLELTGGEISQMTVTHDGFFPFMMFVHWFGYMLPNDRIEMDVFQNSGVNQNLVGAWTANYLSGFRVK